MLHTPGRWWLLPLLILTFWLGARGLDSGPIWSDEQYSLYYAGLGPYGPLTTAALIERIAVEDPHNPPAYVLLLRTWAQFAGDSPPALRALSLFAGLLTLAVTYRLGADLISRRAGLFGAVMLGTNVLFVYYLHEMRVYMALTLVSALMVWCYARLTTSGRRPGPGPWLGLLASTALALYLHHFGALTLAALGSYHLLFGRGRRHWWPVLGVLALGGLVFLPWAQVAIAGLAKFSAEVDVQARALDNATLVYELALRFTNGALVLLPLVLFPALAALPPGARLIGFVAFVITTCFLAANAALQLIPVTRLRYLLLAWPYFALVAAAGIAALARLHSGARAYGRGVALALVAVWATLGVASVDSERLIGELGGARNTYPFHVIARVIEAQALPDDLLVNYLPEASAGVQWNNRAKDYYYAGLRQTYVLVTENPDPRHWAEQIEVLPELLDDRARIWLAYMPNLRPPALASFQAMLDTNYLLCSTVEDRPNLRLELYTLEDMCCAPSQSLEIIARFGDGIRLSTLDGLPGSAGATATFTLGWSLAPSVPIHVYSVTLQIFDSQGEKVAQADYGLPPRAYACQTATFDTSALAPGLYDVRAGVYAWETGERLPGTRTDGGAQGDLLSIGILTVRPD